MSSSPFRRSPGGGSTAWMKTATGTQALGQLSSLGIDESMILGVLDGLAPRDPKADLLTPSSIPSHSLVGRIADLLVSVGKTDAGQAEKLLKQSFLSLVTSLSRTQRHRRLLVKAGLDAQNSMKLLLLTDPKYFMSLEDLDSAQSALQSIDAAMSDYSDTFKSMIENMTS